MLDLLGRAALRQPYDRGEMRRTWLRGRENIHKRYLIYVLQSGPDHAPAHRCRNPRASRPMRCTSDAVLLVMTVRTNESQTAVLAILVSPAKQARSIEHRVSQRAVRYFGRI